MSTIPDFVRALPQNADALLRALSKHIDDAMLEEIASADYGHETDEHLAPLLIFRDTGVFPDSWGHWYPMECLELIRHGKPDDPEWRDRGWNVRGHWKRAFSSACVLRYFGGLGEPAAGGPGVSSAPLVDSLGLLNAGLGSDLSTFLSWLACKTDASKWHDDLPALGAGLLAAELQKEGTSQLVSPLSDWVIETCRDAEKSRLEHSDDRRRLAAELDRLANENPFMEKREALLNAAAALRGQPVQSTVPDDSDQVAGAKPPHLSSRP